MLGEEEVGEEETETETQTETEMETETETETDRCHKKNKERTEEIIKEVVCHFVRIDFCLACQCAPIPHSRRRISPLSLVALTGLL